MGVGSATLPFYIVARRYSQRIFTAGLRAVCLTSLLFVVTELQHAEPEKLMPMHVGKLETGYP